MDDSTRILVVDDEPSITELLTMALRYEGFETAARRADARRSRRSPRSTRTSSCSTS